MVTSRVSVEFIITDLLTGGAERMLVKVLKGINRTRFECRVVSLGPVGEPAKQISSMGIPLTCLGMRPGVPSIIKLRALSVYLAKQKPCIIQTWLYHADLLGGVAARLAGHKHVVWNIRHSGPIRKADRSRTKITAKLCAYLSHFVPERIVCCAESARRKHIAFGYAAEKFVVIPNGFDLECFKPKPESGTLVRASLGIPPASVLVGVVGRYDPAKDHNMFVRAAARVGAQLPSAHFALIGRGLDEQNRELVRALTDANVRDRFHLLGERHDIPDVLSALDVFAMPSRAEAFPNALGEAMAAGLACVSTDAGDARDILGDAGRITTAGDAESFANALLDVLRMTPASRRQLGAQARERIRERFDIQDVISRYEDLYMDVAGLRHESWQ